MQFLIDSHQSTSTAHPIFVDLLAHANGILLVDNHAHPFLVPLQEAEVQNASRNNVKKWTLPRLAELLSEATPVHPTAPTTTARTSLAHSRSVREMRGLLGDVQMDGGHGGGDDDEDERMSSNDELSYISADEVLVERKRARLGAWSLAKLCVSSARLSAILIDDGLTVPANADVVPFSAFQKDLGVPVARRILRLESEAELALSSLIRANEQSLWQRRSGEKGIPKYKAHYYAWSFMQAFRQRIDPLPPGVVSFKSASAYRSGLDISVEKSMVALDEALLSLIFPNICGGDGDDDDGDDDNTVAPPLPPDFNVRLEDPALIQWVVIEGFNVARKHGIPIQFHCGFGDTDLDLTQANPALLRPLFHKFPDVAVVLLHAAWPYSREAAYLASTYPRVFVDFGLAIPLLSVAGMAKAVEMLLEFAPCDKILYSSDAHSACDVVFLASEWGRKVLAAVMTQAVLCGDLSIKEAKRGIRNILSDNAIKLYKLDVYVDVGVGCRQGQ